MVRIGYHASHEQFAPSELLNLVCLAEQAGFNEAKSSDHFHPWSERQGQSGYAWSWLGAALQATRFPIGVISAPGYRYHPAVLAQAGATLGEMFPGRFWLALGSGEAINEVITGAYWPDKAERNARLMECVEVIRALMSGETVTHRGRTTVVDAKLYTRPSTPVPLFGAAMTQATARLSGGWADGLLLAGHKAEALSPLVEVFREAGGGEKPVHVQMAVSHASNLAIARESAVDQWSVASLGGEVAWDLRRPEDFDRASRFTTASELSEALLITDSVEEIADHVAALAACGATVIHLHQVGRNQQEFIDAVAKGSLLRRG